MLVVAGIGRYVVCTQWSCRAKVVLAEFVCMWPYPRSAEELLIWVVNRCLSLRCNC